MRRTLREQIARRCVHFTGTAKPKCAAGIEYDSVAVQSDNPDMGRRRLFPCLSECDSCGSRVMPTTEQVDAEIAEMSEAKRVLPPQTRRGWTR